MRIIYKYNLEIVDTQSINLPVDFEVVSIQNQNGKIAMWILIDESVTTHLDWMFKIVGTGRKVNTNMWSYKGTVQIDAYVWHIFCEI